MGDPDVSEDSGPLNASAVQKTSSQGGLMPLLTVSTVFNAARPSQSMTEDDEATQDLNNTAPMPFSALNVAIA